MAKQSEPAAPATRRRASSTKARRGEPEADLRRAAESLVVAERRLERSPVLGPRAEATRRKLVASANELFRTEGYGNTTVADIAKHARVSLPTFYQYFGELNDVVAVIVVDFIKASLERGLDRWDVVAEGREGLQRLVMAYVRTYVDYADFMELWECAKLMSPKIRALSREYTRYYVHIIEGSLQAGIDAGVVRDDLPAVQMADVTTTTLQYHCYEHFVLSREKPEDLAAEVAPLVSLLSDSLRLSTAR